MTKSEEFQKRINAIEAALSMPASRRQRALPGAECDLIMSVLGMSADILRSLRRDEAQEHAKDSWRNGALGEVA